MFDFGPGRLFIKPADKDVPFVEVGEVTAMIMEFPDGTKLRSGPPDQLFDLEQTDADRQLLAGMKIQTK